MYLNFAAHILATSLGVVTWIFDEVEAKDLALLHDEKASGPNPNSHHFPGLLAQRRMRKYVPSNPFSDDKFVAHPNPGKVADEEQDPEAVAPDVGILTTNKKNRGLLLDECLPGCPQEACDACGEGIYAIGYGRNECTNLLMANCDDLNPWLCCGYGCDVNGTAYATPVEAAYMEVFVNQYCAALNCLYEDNNSYEYCYACQAYPSFCDSIVPFCESFDDAYPDFTCDENGCSCGEVDIAKSCSFAEDYGCPGTGPVTPTPPGDDSNTGATAKNLKTCLLLSIAAGGATAASMFN